jgi:hypothetical protein
MKIKAGQQPEILENIKQNIAAAEKERRELRLAYNSNDFENGNIQVLKNDEFYEVLESYLLTHPIEDKNKLLKRIVRLGDGAVAEDITIRERALALLSSSTKFHLDRNEKEVVFVLVDAICQWLKFETEVLPGHSVLNKRLEDVLVWFLNNSYWVEAEEVFILLYRIQSGSLKKSKAIRSLTSNTLQNLKKKDIVERLTEGYLLENKQQYLFQNILNSIGHKAVIYLFNRVIHSHNRAERLVLLNLIPTFGSKAIPVLEDCLKENPPWAVLRNVIYIVSEIGVDAHYALVARFFGHSDERVQHEMIRCVLKLGGQMMIPRLLKSLDFVNDSMKIHMLRLLVEQGSNDKNVFPALLELAGKRRTFTGQSGHELLHAVIVALKSFPYRESVFELEKMQHEYKKERGTEQLLLHIDEALKVLGPKIRHKLQSVGEIQDLVSFDSDPLQQQLALEKVRKIEEDVQAFVRTGKTQKAVQLIYDQAMAAANSKDFAVAELLRDRVMKIDPRAVAEAIQLGEYIEEQKSSTISSHHLEIWRELYEEMTTEEFNKLYLHLRLENYHRNDVIVQTGETDSNLYFLNSGYVSLSCVVSGKEIFLKRMQPSSVLGGEQFFSPSIWTVTLRALSEVQVHVLEYSAMKKIAETYPSIEEKLRAYCGKYTQVPELLKMSGDDRREFPRYSVVLPTRNILLDPFGNKGKRSFSGELFDISSKGLAFTIRISSTDNASLLLGRHIITTILIGDDELPQQHGIIVGVRLHEQSKQDFSVHVKLSKKMDEAAFKKVISLFTQNQ